MSFIRFWQTDQEGFQKWYEPDFEIHRNVVIRNHIGEQIEVGQFDKEKILYVTTNIFYGIEEDFNLKLLYLDGSTLDYLAQVSPHLVYNRYKNHQYFFGDTARSIIANVIYPLIIENESENE